VSRTTSFSSCAASDSVKAPAVLAFDLGGTRLKAGVVVGERVEHIVAPSLERPGDAQAVVAQMVDVGRSLAAGRPLLAVGAAVKGIVSAESGRILEVNEPLRSLSGLDLGAELRRAFGVAVAIENDARLFAYGELAYGAGRGVRNLVGVTLGTGVGVGVALDGVLLSGGRGVLGILGGHVSIDWQGPECDCGSRGCLELYVAGPRASELLSADPVDSEALDRFTRALALGLVNLVHAYDPDVVVIGGGLAHRAELYLDGVREEVARRAWTIPRGRVRIELSALGEEAALLGAAALAQAAA
jgi:glucokinase